MRISDWSSDVCSSDLQQRILSSSEAGRSYRSMRRHLLKRYLQPHRECLRNLLSASRTESQCLHCKKVCIVALAFVVWQMSIEGVSNIEAFRSEEHTSELQSLMRISYAVFCLKKKK